MYSITFILCLQVTNAYVDLIRKLTRLLHAKRKNSEFEKELGTVLSLHIEILMVFILIMISVTLCLDKKIFH